MITKAKPGSRSIVSNDEFCSNWDVMTQGIFKGVDWSNLFVAGGCVLGCLLSGKL
jgi:hypothetical protein